MISFKELLEKKKQPDYTITITNQKDTRKAFDLLKKNKVKFRDESSNLFSFKKEDQWEAAMDLFDEYDIDFEIDG